MQQIWTCFSVRNCLPTKTKAWFSFSGRENSSLLYCEVFLYSRSSNGSPLHIYSQLLLKEYGMTYNEIFLSWQDFQTFLLLGNYIYFGVDPVLKHLLRIDATLKMTSRSQICPQSSMLIIEVSPSSSLHNVLQGCRDVWGLGDWSLPPLPPRIYILAMFLNQSQNLNFH